MSAAGRGIPNLVAHYERMRARPAMQRPCEIEAAIGCALPERR
jgi:glutathione S-transferase